MAFEPRYRTLVDLLEQSLAVNGSRELFGTKKDGRWRFVTYAEFGGAVERFRAGLSSLGVGRGDRVAVISNNRVEWAVAAYASYGSGAALVPMYEAQNPDEWEFIVRDCEAKVLVVANARVFAKARALLSRVATLRSIVLLEDAADRADSRIVTYASMLDAGRGAAP